MTHLIQEIFRAPKGQNFIKKFSRYSFMEFTYILIIFKGCYDAGNTYQMVSFWEATSQNNKTVLKQLERKIFIYSNTGINSKAT